MHEKAIQSENINYIVYYICDKELFSDCEFHSNRMPFYLRFTLKTPHKKHHNILTPDYSSFNFLIFHTSYEFPVAACLW